MEITPLNDYNSPSTTVPTRDGNKKFRWLIGVIFGVLLLVTLAAVSAAVYVLPVNDGFVRSITTAVPYPVALINLQPIFFKDFYKEYDASQNFYTVNGTAEEERLPAAEMSTNILETMINHAAVNQLAKQYSIKLDQVKLEEKLQEAYTQSGSEEKFFSDIENQFGWSREDFLTHAMKPLVLSEQINEVVLADSTLQVEATDKINQALTRIKNNEDFGTVAGEFSEDSSATNGGDIGHLTTDQMPEQWLEFVSTTELNVPSEVIDVGQVYTIVMVTEKVEDGEQAQYNIKVIVVYKQGLSEVIDSFLSSSKVWKLVKA